MNMSLLIIQSANEAAKREMSPSGTAGPNNEGTSQFQALLDTKMTQPAAEKQNPGQQQGSPQAGERPSDRHIDSTDVLAKAGEIVIKTRFSADTLLDQLESEVIYEEDVDLLTQIMAVAVGSQIIPLEPSPGDDTVELAEDASRILFTDVGGDTKRPVIAQSAVADEGIEAKVADEDAGFTRIQAAAAPAERTAGNTTPENITARGAEVRSELSVSQPQQSVTPAAASQGAAPATVQPEAAGIPPAVRVMQPLGTPEWNQAVGQRILWMVGQEQQSASLILNPPDLGPVRIVLSISNNQASANFFSAHPDVRSALEGSLPRLREMLEGAGVELGQTHVGGDSQDNQQPGMYSHSGDPLAWMAGAEAEGEGASSVTEAVRRTVSRGLIDTFA